MNSKLMVFIAIIAVFGLAGAVGITAILQNVDAHTCVTNSASGKFHCSNSKNDNHNELNVPRNQK
jgi:hypothetical protein